MIAQPEELHPALSQAYNAGDLDAVVSLYDPQAVYVIKPGRVTSGPAELRAALKFVVDLRARLTVKPDTFIRAEDLVLVLGTFTFAGRRPDGGAFNRTSRFADVLRRQPDGGWLVLIDTAFAGE